MFSFVLHLHGFIITQNVFTLQAVFFKSFFVTDSAINAISKYSAESFAVYASSSEAGAVVECSRYPVNEDGSFILTGAIFADYPILSIIGFRCGASSITLRQRNLGYDISMIKAGKYNGKLYLFLPATGSFYNYNIDCTSIEFDIVNCKKIISSISISDSDPTGAWDFVATAQSY